MPNASLSLNGEVLRQVVRRSEIPPAIYSGTPKCFWESVVLHVRLLNTDEALEITFPDPIAAGFRSSIFQAAAKFGLKVSVVYRGATLYVWRVGVCQPGRNHPPPRKPIRCMVCGATIIRPVIGASQQLICPPRDGKIPICRLVRRLMLNHGISLSEAKARCKRWQQEKVKQHA